MDDDGGDLAFLGLPPQVRGALHNAGFLLGP